MKCCTWHGTTQLLESETLQVHVHVEASQSKISRDSLPVGRARTKMIPLSVRSQEFFQALQDRSVGLCFCLCCLTDCSQPKARSVHVEKVIVFSLFVHLSASCHQCHRSRGTALWNYYQASVVPSFTVLLLCLPALPAACVAGNCIELMWRRRKLMWRRRKLMWRRRKLL
jgi:hypothetical protein